MDSQGRPAAFTVFLLVVAIILTAVAAHRWDAARSFAERWLPIRFVRVEGTFQYLEKKEIQEALAPWVTVNYMTADMGEIRKAAEAVPWIERAQIQRIWPDTIVVRVYEQQPFARWRDQSLLNPRGEPFTPPSVEGFQALPKVTGPKGYETQLLVTLKKMDAALTGLGLELAELIVNERRAWSVKLEGGTIIQMGRREPLKAFARMLRVLPLLGEARIAAMESIDLRYPNGFAVSWKPEGAREGNGAAGKTPLKKGLNINPGGPKRA